MKRILIVEDDRSLCLQLADLLNEFGFETGVADDGLRALKMLGQADPLPDVILLDLHMPNLDGWGLREALKNHDRYCNIPVIIMSGDTTLTSVEADAHLVKPLDLSQLLNAISKN